LDQLGEGLGVSLRVCVAHLPRQVLDLALCGGEVLRLQTPILPAFSIAFLVCSTLISALVSLA